jgi:hypothetical protein
VADIRAPKPLDEQEFERVVQALIEEAELYTDQYRREGMQKAWRAWRGEDAPEPAEGGSDVVSMEVRDTAMGLMPSLMEIFAGSDEVVEFYDDGSQRPPALPLDQGPPPSNPEQATAYANACWREYGGWATLYDAAMEALIADLGVFKVHKVSERKAQSFAGTVSEWGQLEGLAASDGVQIDSLDHQRVPHPLVPGQAVWTGAKVSGRRYYWVDKLCIEAIPASDWNATPGDDPETIKSQHETLNTTFGELVALGIEPGELEGLATPEEPRSAPLRVARSARERPRRDAHGHWALQPTMVRLGTCLIDADGDGLPERWRFLCVGAGKKLLRRQRDDHQPYVPFSAYRWPHRLEGLGLDVLVGDIQELKTEANRALNDNAKGINQPLMLYGSGVDAGRLASWRKEKIVKESVPGSVRWFQPPPIINELIAVLQALDEQKMQRTGMSAHAAGLPPDALANVAATTAMATVGATQQKIELVARTIAETGLVPLFKKLLTLTQDLPQRRLPGRGGQEQHIDPRGFDPGWGVRAVVGLGNMRRMELRQFYQQYFGLAMQAVGALGAENPVLGLAQMVAAIRSWVGLYPGVRVAELVGDVQTATAYARQKAQQPKPDPAMAKVQGQLQLQKAHQEGQRQLEDLHTQHRMQLEQAQAAHAAAVAQGQTAGDAQHAQGKLALQAADQIHRQSLAEQKVQDDAAAQMLKLMMQADMQRRQAAAKQEGGADGG